VTLQGEAWFKVSHDASRPFAIRVGTTTVEDIGTAFLVRESPTRAVTVRVAEGAVRLTTRAAARDSTVTLRAGDGAVATAGGITVAAGVVSATEGVALAAGRLAFNDASLVEVQDALHRWYGVRLIIADNALAARHVTADFTGEPVSRVAAVLGLTLGVNAESRGDTIELHGAAGVPTRP
jgi:transmembrane sensor